MFRQLIVSLVLIPISIFPIGCATTTGPAVSSAEVKALQTELKAKAVRYRASQVARVKVIAERLIGYMPLEDQERLKGIRYDVFEGEEINAHVTPGNLVVNYGMLRFTDSDDELAVVIAHELAHLSKGHYGKKLATSIVANAIGLAAGVAIESISQGSGVGGTVAQGVSRGVAGGFSRDLEREADYFGFQYVYIAGFDLAKGAGVWERFAVEAPKSMSSNLFSTHPASPERLLRAQKTFAELSAQGIAPNHFNRPPQASISSSGSGIFQGALALPGRVVTGAVAVPVNVLSAPAHFAPSGSNQVQNSSNNGEASQPAMASEEQKEIESLRDEVKRLRQAQEERLKHEAQEGQKWAREQAEMERILLEAKEAAKELRYSEFGIKDMGIAKKVTNLWVAKKVSGEQRIFPLSQRSIDWFVQYDYLSANSWKALGLMHRKYRAYWYSPNGRLFSEQEFGQSEIRAEFAKTTLRWDPELGNYLIGEWLVRIFENGKLVDERTFEVVQVP